MTQDAQQVDPLIGTTVAGKYKIVRLLGEGGMGCVYLAEQQLGTTARKVAFKTLHKHLSQDDHIKTRFHREAGTVASLEHPNTIQVYDFGEMSDGTLYLVMEYVQGRSVADWLEKDGPMPPARVEHIFRQVCGSLEEAHNHGIIHRDLKPDNVVLCERAGQKDWVEVLDFGIAKRSTEHDPNEAKLTQQGMVLGTPPYMSPEQFTGQPIDVRSDIYALGVMAYEMLTGRLPFEANTAWEWASKHMTEPPCPIETQPLGPNVPDKMRAAITRALAKNREERFGSVQEFFEAFAGCATRFAIPDGGMHTAVIAPAAARGAPAAAPRAKTEMATPAPLGGPPISAPSPALGMAPGPAAAVPAPPPAPAKKGGSGLIIGLGELAVLLLAGAGIGLAVKKKKDVVVVPTSEPIVSASATATAESSATPDPATVATVEPLSPGKTTVAVNNAVGPKPGAKPIPTPSAKPSAAPPPPPPPPAEPPVCAQARSARARNSPVAARLEMQCIAAGGKL